MTIMVESGRTFLFTEYARTICGVMSKQSTDPSVWNKLPDRFSAHPLTKDLLIRAEVERVRARAASDYFHTLDLLQGAPKREIQGLQFSDVDRE